MLETYSHLFETVMLDIKEQEFIYKTDITKNQL